MAVCVYGGTVRSRLLSGGRAPSASLRAYIHDAARVFGSGDACANWSYAIYTHEPCAHAQTHQYMRPGHTTHTCTHIHTYIHTHTHIHNLTHIHTHTHMDVGSNSSTPIKGKVGSSCVAGDVDTPMKRRNVAVVSGSAGAVSESTNAASFFA